MYLLEKLLPFFLITALGFVCARKHFFPEAFMAAANRLVFYIALPATLFKSIAGQAGGELSVLPAAAVALAIPLGGLCALLISLPLFGSGPSAKRATWMQCSVHSNQSIGLPALFFLFGEQGMLAGGLMFGVLIVVQNVFSMLIYHSYGQAVDKDRHQSLGELGRNLCTNPTVLATLAGLVAYLAGSPLPTILLDTVGILAGMFLPLALLSLGIHLAQWKRAAVPGQSRNTLLLFTSKTALLPLIGLAIALAFDLSTLEKAAVVIGLASPTALVSSVFAAELGGDTQQAATIVGLTHTLCPLSYTLWLHLIT